MRVAEGDGEKLQEPQPRAVCGRRDQRRQGQRGRGKGGELSHYPSLRQRAGAARGSTRRRALSACTCSWGVPGLGSSTAACNNQRIPASRSTRRGSNTSKLPNNPKQAPQGAENMPRAKAEHRKGEKRG